MQSKSYHCGIEIDEIAVCDFGLMKRMSNQDILELGRGKVDPKLANFLSKKMGIETRYHCPDELSSFELAANALDKLISKQPEIIDEAEFFIFAGISNPLPTVCTSSLLACDKGFKKASCWDLKSGCSSGVLAMQQALDWVNLGAKKGVIICAESMTKFANPEALQMSASTGDGACAMIVKKSESWKVLGSVHGTDSRFMRSMYVPGKYPVKKDFNPLDYVFTFDEKGETLEMMAHYWMQSLSDLLKVSSISGSEVTDYIAHQVDGTKNKKFALAQEIPESSVALNFRDYGNMGCPTVFINYAQWMQNRENDFSRGDKLVLHAVGGGLSWAGLCLERV